VSRRLLTVLMMTMAVMTVVTPVHAQEAAGAASAGSELVKWSIITAGFALAVAAAFGALGQSRPCQSIGDRHHAFGPLSIACFDSAR